jgi:hypothetical protein
VAEVARCLQGADGGVARHLAGGVKHVLFGDGSVSWWLPRAHPVPGPYQAVFAAEALVAGVR